MNMASKWLEIKVQYLCSCLHMHTHTERGGGEREGEREEKEREEREKEREKVQSYLSGLCHFSHLFSCLSSSEPTLLFSVGTSTTFLEASPTA